MKESFSNEWKGMSTTACQLPLHNVSPLFVQEMTHRVPKKASTWLPRVRRQPPRLSQAMPSEVRGGPCPFGDADEVTQLQMRLTQAHSTSRKRRKPGAGHVGSQCGRSMCVHDFAPVWRAANPRRRARWEISQRGSTRICLEDPTRRRGLEDSPE